MNKLKVGFSRVNANPPVGIEISGYYVERFSDGILDDLEINGVAVGDGKNTCVILTMDICYFDTPIVDEIREYVSSKTGLKKEFLFIHTTHTHTSPYVRKDGNKPFEIEYLEFLKTRFTDCVNFAIADMKSAKMGVAIGKAENISFIRRFRMKDGTVATNPGPNNPQILGPIGEVDERVNVIRFDRENSESVIVCNFGTHPDVVGGNKLSGDWPALTRRFVEKAIDNTKCIFLNGVQGDVNHVNVHPKAGDLNDMFLDFDNVERGYAHSKHMGRVVAGAVMSVFDKVEYLKDDEVRCVERIVDIPSNMPDKDEIELAHKYNDLHNQGRDDLIPFKGMALTTVVAESARKVKLEHGPSSFQLSLMGLAIGEVALFGIPGEPFTGVGRAIKENKEWKLICPVCLVNGCEGYFPMQEAYDEGGYETGTSRFKAGCAELLIKYGKEILDKLN